MTKSSTETSSIWPYVGFITGALLLLAGTIAAFSFLGLRFFLPGANLLAAQMGQMAALGVTLIGGGLLFFHSLNAIRHKPSRPFHLPRYFFFIITFAVVLGLGNVLLTIDPLGDIFPILFLLGAALPTIGVLAWTSRKLSWPVSWRQTSVSLLVGGTISVIITLLISGILSGIIFFLVFPLEILSGSISDLLSLSGAGFIESFFFSPYIWVFLFITALQAPIPEEFAKAIGPAFYNRRLGNERQAFMLGLAAGAGFAIMENMLYQGIYAQWSGWSWGGITLLRAIGAVLHPLCTAIIALALYRDRARTQGWFGRVAKAYLFSVLIHTLWNGGFEALFYMTGLDYFSGLGGYFDVYGMSVQILLILYLVLLSLALWWLLHRIVRGIAQEVEPQIAPEAISSRALAILAFAALLVIVPLGALLGPAWPAIQSTLAAATN